MCQPESDREHFVRSGTKRLRCGFTTGTAAALAAQGAARLLLGEWPVERARLITPRGWAVEVSLTDCARTETAAQCGVRKDGGDDIDATDGAVILARVERRAEPGIVILGGPGVGRVTLPGLDQPVGEAAINRVPRQMIEQAARQVCDTLDYPGGLTVTISVPEGERLAQKTFNPQLGIVGGISILGTSGIVEPMSVEALVASIELELRQKAALGHRRVVLTPGGYGLAWLAAHPLPGQIPVVKCSNFLGETLDAARLCGFEQILIVGHIGKLVKLAGGIFNTHSHVADCRCELFAAHAALSGAPQPVVERLMSAATTDACLEILDMAELREPVLQSLLTAAQCRLDLRCGPGVTGLVLFSNRYGLLGRTAQARSLTKQWEETP